MGDVDAADCGYGSTQCSDHPYRTTKSGGVCALCVQERLCKLINVSYSSQSSLPLRSSYSSSSSASRSTPSFVTHATSRRSRMSKEKTKKKMEAMLRRTNSLAASVILHPKDDSPRKRWLWPFSVTNKKVGHGGAVRWNCREKVEENNIMSLNIERAAVVVQEDKDQESTQISERKITRSRSVGCGNRSFSGGDFLERISTGFADCAYRRTGSQRQGNCKDESHQTILQNSSTSSIVQQSDNLSTPVVTLLWVPDNKADGVDASLATITSKTKGHRKGWGWAAFATPMTSIRSYVASYPTTPSRRRLFAKK